MDSHGPRVKNHILASAVSRVIYSLLVRCFHLLRPKIFKSETVRYLVAYNAHAYDFYVIMVEHNCGGHPISSTNNTNLLSLFGACAQNLGMLSFHIRGNTECCHLFLYKRQAEISVNVSCQII